MFDKVLNMPRVLNMPWFYICQSFEDARITEGYENDRNIPEYAHYAWIYLNMS